MKLTKMERSNFECDLYALESKLRVEREHWMFATGEGLISYREKMPVLARQEMEAWEKMAVQLKRKLGVL